MKKQIIIIVDIITSMIIMLHIQSLICFIIEEFLHLYHYDIFEYIQFHRHRGILGFIELTSYTNVFFWFVFLIYILNIAVIQNQIKAIKKREKLFKSIYKYYIIVNLVFILFKSIEYSINLYTVMMG